MFWYLALAILSLTTPSYAGGGINRGGCSGAMPYVFVADRVVGCDGFFTGGMFGNEAAAICDQANGWRICTGAADAAQQGLTAGLCADSPVNKFYATQQRGTGSALCDGMNGANDVFGCGGSGLGLPAPNAASCTPLSSFSGNLFSSYTGSQWSCASCNPNGFDELTTVAHTFTDGVSDGGVMCCHDAPTSTTGSPATSSPSRAPSMAPSITPSTIPSMSPSAVPSMSPSFSPSFSPSGVPSVSPSFAPSSTPSAVPSAVPSMSPSFAPSSSPSFTPSAGPSSIPSVSPSFAPSLSPSGAPSTSPTLSPTFCYNNIPEYETDNVGKSGKFRLTDPCDPAHCILIELKRIEEYNCSTRAVDPRADIITNFAHTNWTFNNSFYQGDPLIPVLTSSFEKVFTFPRSASSKSSNSKSSKSSKSKSTSDDGSKKNSKKKNSKKSSKKSGKGGSKMTTTMKPSYNVTVDVDVLYFYQRGDFIPIEIEYGCCDAIDVEKNGLKFDVRIKGWKFQSPNNCLRVLFNFKVNNCSFPTKPISSQSSSSSSSDSSDDASFASKSSSSSRDGSSKSKGGSRKKKQPWYKRYGSGSQSKSASQDGSSKKKNKKKKKTTKDGRKINTGVMIPFDSLTYLRTPDVGYFDGKNASNRRPVHVKSTVLNTTGEYSVVLGFPAFNESVYYDPVIVLNPTQSAPPTRTPTKMPSKRPSQPPTDAPTERPTVSTTTTTTTTTSTVSPTTSTAATTGTKTSTTTATTSETTKDNSNGVAGSNSFGVGASESVQSGGSSGDSSAGMWAGIGAAIAVLGCAGVGLYVWKKRKNGDGNEGIWETVNQRESMSVVPTVGKVGHARSTSQQGLVTHAENSAKVETTIYEVNDEDEE